MKRSVSSVLAERRKRRNSVTGRAFKLRHVKFAPGEMAIDAADVDASKPPVIARNRKEWKKFLSVKRGYVRLDSDLRSFYGDERNLNNLLRQLMELARSNS